MTQPLPADPHEGIKADDNPEARAAQGEQSTYIARAGMGGGAVTTGPEPGDEQPSQRIPGGTAGGDVLSGVTADPEDVAEAVSGDTGPLDPAPRRRP